LTNFGANVNWPGNDMTEDKRAELITIFEAAAGMPIKGHDTEWLRLLDLLKLPGFLIPAVKEALKQGRWRQSRNPRAYIKIVAQREALGMGLVDYADDPNTVTADAGGQPLELDVLAFAANGFGPIKTSSGAWHQGSGEFSDDYQNDYNEFGEHLTTLLERLGQRIPRELRKPETDRPDWVKIAELAELDEGERLVLTCRLWGISRDVAIAGQAAEEDKRWIQAAWKRFDRNGLKKLRAVLIAR
jgi:hypothetical protein